MNTSLFNIKAIKPQCSNDNNGSIIINDISNGVLSFSWIDLDTGAVVTDYGRAVYNLVCGTYTLKVYNILKRSNEIIEIDLSCADPLSLDLVHVDELKCYNDEIHILIEWSGGVGPYTLYINKDKITTSTNAHTHRIFPNIVYNITLTDKNECSVRKNDISVFAQPLSATVRWEPITQHNGVSDQVVAIVSGGKPPYKTAWFLQDQSQPILINQESIVNTLKAGSYQFVVVDSNGCRHTKQFTITQPPPISANVTVFNDYSSKALFPPAEAGLVYNLLLIPLEDKYISDDQILKSSAIYLKHTKHKVQQKLCLDYGVVELEDQKYRYYYISPGLNSLQTYKTTLMVDDAECVVDHKIGSSRPKLLIGSLVFRNDHSFAFKSNDIINIASNTGDLNIQINQAYIKTGLYFSNDIYTILNLINPNLPLSDGFVFANNPDNKTISAQSLTTKSNQRLGSIICNVSNGDKNSLEAILIDSNNDEQQYSFNNKYTLTIDNLKYGTYKLSIKDKYSTASVFNNSSINDTFFTIDILDSCEKERDLSSIQSAHMFNLNPKLLNLYNERPNKLLFSVPEFKNGVLMNISPLDACYTIVGDGIDIQDCGYKIIDNLPHGKYTITIFKDGYSTETFKIFYNTDKDLVTAILKKN